MIQKVTSDGGRRSEKVKITEDEYHRSLDASMLHVTKTRYEFTYAQNDTTLSVKYDEFADSNLRILEVDAETDQERGAFDPTNFPHHMTEVTGNLSYYGYRIAYLL